MRVRRKIKISMLFLGAGAVVVVGVLLSCSHLLTPSAQTRISVAEAGKDTLHGVRSEKTRPAPANPTASKLVDAFADHEPGKWEETGKVWAPRVLFAKLKAEKDVGAVNEYIQKVEPWSEAGSSWIGHSGDYDFTETVLTSILYTFGNKSEILFPETRRHLVENLLVEKGGEPRQTAPNSLGLVTETENHILMTESTRFLKNQWMKNHGHEESRYDNRANGLHKWLLRYLDRIRREGFVEFNSMPYQGYAVHSLLNLEAFADSEEIKATACRILDQLAGHYVLGSLSLRQVVPFRRQVRRAENESLTLNYMNSMMSVWSTPREGSARKIEHGRIHAFIAAALPYRPSAETIRLVRKKPVTYYLRIGHGKGSSPEIFSGAPGFLLSAGGVYRGLTERVVARPTALLLQDGAETLSECFHLPAEGDWKSWNNTGVHKRFACGKGPVNIPDRYESSWESELWALYTPGSLSGYTVAVHSTARTGIIVLLKNEGKGSEQLGRALKEVNADQRELRRHFEWPTGQTISYELDAPSDKWVISKINGESVDRNYDTWTYPREKLADPGEWIRKAASSE